MSSALADRATPPVIGESGNVPSARKRPFAENWPQAAPTGTHAGWVTEETQVSALQSLGSGAQLGIFAIFQGISKS